MGRPPAVDDLAVVDGDLLEAEESAAAFLIRLQVASETGRLPVDVGRWAVAQLTDRLPQIARQNARNRHLRVAANLISGTTWAKARRLEQEVLAARGRRPRRARVRPREATVAYHVRQALALDPDTPASLRHLLRVVTGGDLT